MGKAKRFNSYDATVAENRKLVQSYGAIRQNLSIGSSTRSMPLSPNTGTTSAAGGATGTGDGKFLTASLSADQTTNLAVSDHVEFDTKDEDGGIVLQTGAGQLDGIFELSSGKKYQLSSHLRPEFSGATGQLVVVWYDITNAAEIGARAIYESQTHASHNANQPVAEAIVTPTTNITVEVRIIAVTALTALANEYCVANLFEIALGGSGSGGSGGGSGVSFPLTPTINDHGSVGTVTEDLDLSAATGHVHKMELTGNPTLTFSNPPSSGIQIEFEVEFVQDGTGGHTVTWPASVVETVTISTTAGSTTIVTVRTNDGGTTYHAIPALRGSITLSGAALQTPWLSDIDAAGFSLSSLELTEYDPITKPASNNLGKIYVENLTGDELVLNGPISGKVRLDIDGTELAEFDATAAQFQSTLGYDFTFFRDDATPNDNDNISNLDFQGNNSIAGADIYARIAINQKDVTSTTEDGEFVFSVMDAGTLTEKLTIHDTGTIINDGYFEMNDEIRFTGITKPVSNTISKIYAENLTNDDLVLNAATSGQVRLDIAGTEAIAVRSTAADLTSTLGYDLTFYRDDATPNDNDNISNIDFQGNDSGAGADIYARIAVIQTDVTAGTEDGDIIFSTANGGTLDEIMRLDGSVLEMKMSGAIDMNANDIDDIGALNMNSPPDITGSRGGNAALADLLTSLASIGLITDSTTA